MKMNGRVLLDGWMASLGGQERRVKGVWLTGDGQHCVPASLRAAGLVWG